MRAFCMQQWQLIVLLIVAVLCIVAFPVWGDWVTKNPFDAVISLSPPGLVREEIEIRIPEHYMVQLKFERDEIEFEQLKKLIGAMGVCLPKEECSKGEPVPIRWSLKNRETNETASSGLAESIDSNTWSRAHVYRRVGDIHVQPGKYVFEAEVTRPVPELAHIRTHIAIELHPKNSTTWQIGLVWWGQILIFIVVWPAAIIIALVLLWRAGLTFRSKGRAASGAPLS